MEGVSDRKSDSSWPLSIRESSKPPESLQRSRAPSRLTHVGDLELLANDLGDRLVEGRSDSFQRVGSGEGVQVRLVAQVLEQLGGVLNCERGSVRPSRRGEARAPELNLTREFADLGAGQDVAVAEGVESGCKGKGVSAELASAENRKSHSRILGPGRVEA
jgi:hypothetical protein